MADDREEKGREGESGDHIRPFDDHAFFNAVIGKEKLDEPVDVLLTVRDAGTIFSTLMIVKGNGLWTTQMAELAEKFNPDALGFGAWPEVIG